MKKYILLGFDGPGAHRRAILMRGRHSFVVPDLAKIEGDCTGVNRITSWHGVFEIESQWNHDLAFVQMSDFEPSTAT